MSLARSQSRTNCAFPSKAACLEGRMYYSASVSPSKSGDSVRQGAEEVPAARVQELASSGNVRLL